MVEDIAKVAENTNRNQSPSNTELSAFSQYLDLASISTVSNLAALTQNISQVLDVNTLSFNILREQSQYSALTEGIEGKARVLIESIQFLDITDNAADQPVSQLILNHKTVISSIAVSVGLVTWAAQLGALFASVLATVPAWKNLDPIAILGNDEDDDTLWDGYGEDAEEDSEQAASELLSSESRA